MAARPGPDRRHRPQRPPLPPRHGRTRSSRRSSSSCTGSSPTPTCRTPAADAETRSVTTKTDDNRRRIAPVSLPYVNPAEVLGLMSLIGDEPQDLFDLAEKFGREFGAVVRIVKAAELLGFVQTPGQDVQVTPLGKELVNSSTADQKRIVREQLLKLKIFELLVRLIKVQENQVPRERGAAAGAPGGPAPREAAPALPHAPQLGPVRRDHQPRPAQARHPPLRGQGPRKGPHRGPRPPRRPARAAPAGRCRAAGRRTVAGAATRPAGPGIAEVVTGSTHDSARSPCTLGCVNHASRETRDSNRDIPA